jgi:hypothetical protein
MILERDIVYEEIASHSKQCCCCDRIIERGMLYYKSEETGKSYCYQCAD